MRRGGLCPYSVADGTFAGGPERGSLSARSLWCRCNSTKVRVGVGLSVQSSCWHPPRRSPLFDRPKRGRKKPHQPALAHFVRVAGRDALRLTVLPRIRAANRNSLRSDTDSRKGAEGHTLVVPLCKVKPSETPHRERPGVNQGEGKQGARPPPTPRSTFVLETPSRERMATPKRKRQRSFSVRFRTAPSASPSVRLCRRAGRFGRWGRGPSPSTASR